MNKYIVCLLFFVTCFGLSACSEDNESSSNSSNDVAVETSSKVEDKKREDNKPKKEEVIYFNSDNRVNEFLVDYNKRAEIVIPKESVEQGNIRNKALINTDDLWLEIINSNDCLYISMSSTLDDESTKLYAAFRDTIKTVQADATDEAILNAWNDIHSSGYMVNDYDFNGINISYVPSKLQTSVAKDLRVDLEIPLN